MNRTELLESIKTNTAGILTHVTNMSKVVADRVAEGKASDEDLEELNIALGSIREAAVQLERGATTLGTKLAPKVA